MIQVGDWVEWGTVPFFPEYPLYAKVIHSEMVEFDRTIRHPFKKRVGQLLVLEGESGTILRRFAHDVRRIPTAEEELGGDYV